MMAFNSVGNLFVADYYGGNVVEITPTGTENVFSSESGPVGIAFENISLPIPEPSTLGFFFIGSAMFLIYQYCCRNTPTLKQ
jgi:hypothetical protein